MAESSPKQDISGSLLAGSEVTYDIVCYTCDSDDRIQEAEGYCLDCCEHLCTTCLKYHKIVSATKHHKLVDKDNMPGKQSTLPVSDICTERCLTHKDEIIKYFCPKHDVFGCSVCVTLNHKLCEDVAYLPELAGGFGDSQEFKAFQANLEDLIKKSENIIKSTQDNIKLTADYRAKATEDIEVFIQEMHELLNKLKYELQEQADQIAANDSENMGSLAGQSKQVLVELKRLSSDIKILFSKKQHCQMFIEMKNTESKLKGLQKQLEEAEDNCVTAFKFQPNEDLQKLVERKDALGKLFVQIPKEMNSTHVSDINVKSNKNTETCYVNGAALVSNSKLVITDFINSTVKLIDTELKQIISEYQPETRAVDVTRVNKTLVGVTLPDARKILFLRVENNMSLDKEITLSQPCCYLASIEDKLVVSFREPCEIKLLSMRGEVLQTFAYSSKGERLFSMVPRVTVSTFNQAIYASDWDSDRVTMLDMDGTVRAVFEQDDLMGSTQTAVDDMGMVYLCGSDSNNIHLLTSNCSILKVLLQKIDGMQGPYCVCYCGATRRLYIGMTDNDNMKVYQLS